MKATELIKRLQELVEEHGDLEFFAHDSNFDYVEMAAALSLIHI